MKIKLLSFLFGAVFAGEVAAQSAVTIYGIVDGGIRRVTNVNAAGEDRLTMGSTGTYNLNRLGFKGVEDLGGGMNTHFVLEMGFNSGTGALDNTVSRLFQRSALVGVGGTWGTLDFGRQYTNAFQTIIGYDPLGYKYSGFNSTIGATAGVRYDNDIKFTKELGPVTARIEYALGETTGSTRTNSTTSVSAVYKDDSLFLGTAYTSRDVSEFNFNHWTAGGAYKFGPARVSIGYASQTQDAAISSQKTRFAWTGLSYAINPLFEVTAAYYQTKLSGITTGKRDLAILAATYALSKRTTLYADYDLTKNDGVQLASPAQRHQNGISFGVNHTF
jgi:predicted porin